MSVFISHSFEDKAKFDDVCYAFERDDIVHWKPDEIVAGQSLREKLRLAIRDCSVCVFIATRNSLSSGWCQAEIGAFWGAGKPVVVYLADKLKEEELPKQFQGDKYTSSIRHIVSAVKQHLAGRDDGDEDEDEGGLAAFAFDTVVAELSETVDRLEAEGEKLMRIYTERGDLARLIDGLYSGILYASRGAVTGTMGAQFYGNLMEVDSATQHLRVRYSSGPYNDEIVTRSFPIEEGPRLGVASEALISGEVAIRNSMESEITERGEARLQAMISIPVPGAAEASGGIAVLNLDSGKEGVFPDPEEWDSSPVKARAEQLAHLLSRVNDLHRKVAEDG